MKYKLTRQLEVLPLHIAFVIFSNIIMFLHYLTKNMHITERSD